MKASASGRRRGRRRICCGGTLASRAARRRPPPAAAAPGLGRAGRQNRKSDPRTSFPDGGRLALGPAVPDAARHDFRLASENGRTAEDRSIGRFKTPGVDRAGIGSALSPGAGKNQRRDFTGTACRPSSDDRKTRGTHPGKTEGQFARGGGGDRESVDGSVLMPTVSDGPADGHSRDGSIIGLPCA